MSTIILGSQSPRRKEILGYFSLPFLQAAPTFDEETVQFQGDPITYVHDLSDGKAASLAPLYPKDIILTADTVVYCDGKVYNKPKDRREAFLFLSELAGRWHSVYTGVTLQQGPLSIHQAEETRVLFNEVNSDHIHCYLDRTPWADKAGGYAIQMASGLLVNKIDGCFYNVMGLPLNTVRQLFAKIGIDLWHYMQ